MVEKGQNPKIKIAIVAGEKSGDELGAPLMQSLKSLNPSIEFVGVGGSKMISEGLDSFFDMNEISVMGIIEPLLNLKKLLQEWDRFLESGLLKRKGNRFFLSNPKGMELSNQILISMFKWWDEIN